MRLEPVPEMFPLIREEFSEDVIEILIGSFASPDSEDRQDFRVPEAAMCTLRIEIVPDR